MPSPTRRRPSSSCVESAGEVWCVSELIVVCNGDVVSWGTGERLAPGFGIFGGRVGWVSGCAAFWVGRTRGPGRLAQLEASSTESR